jgi:hypothetical protein
MKLQKFIAIIVLALLMGATAAAPRQPLGGLSVTGYSLESIRPQSLRGLSGAVSVGVRNTGSDRTLRNVSAVLYKSGKKVAQGHCSDIVLKSGTSTIRVTGQVSLAEGVSLFTAMAAALSFHPSEYTADVVCSVVDANGRAETLVRRGIPIGNYIK